MIYTHYSQPLTQVVRGLLTYSNNFTANQIMLALAADEYDAPADLTKGHKALRAFLSELGLDNIVIEEGSGLSRKNRISAQEMLIVLKHFRPYAKLLEADAYAYAKTGTLTAVHTYAGYLRGKQEQLYPCVIMMDKSVPFHYRKRLTRRLHQR